MTHHTTPTVIWVGLELEPSTGSDFIDVKTALTRDFAKTLGPSIEVLLPAFTMTGAEYAEPEPDVLSIVGDGIPGIGAGCFRYLKIEGNFDGDVPDQYFFKELPETWWVVALSQYVADAVEMALQLADLTHPGAVQCAGGAVKLPTGLHAHITKKQFLQELHLMKRKKGQWPELKTLDGLAAARWAVDVGLTKSRTATTRLQRALAAFTHLDSLIFNGHNEKLFRTMQALEAFYTDGKGDLQYQLSRKSEVWLGPQIDNGLKKRKISTLYEIRSGFVHGSSALEFRRSFRPDVKSDASATATVNEEYLDFAVQVLVASLQRCIEGGVASLNWRFEPVINEAP